MMKAKKDNNLIFGLSDENIKRLKEGQPIKFNLNELGMDDINVYIFHGKNEQEMKTMFKDSIHPFLTIIKDSNAEKN